MSDQMTHISEILKQLSNIDHIKAEEIPNIDLYMDQVTTFMDTHLEHSKRYPEDKILTKTMINNYAKNRLLPPPDRKKYSKDHMLLLLFIYYFKNILSITDIQSLLMPICEKYFGQKEGMNLTEIYEEVFSLEKDQLDTLIDDVEKKYQIASGTFTSLPEQEQDAMQNFSFTCMLAFDVYVKKQIIEALIDHMNEKQDSEN